MVIPDGIRVIHADVYFWPSARTVTIHEEDHCH